MPIIVVARWDGSPIKDHSHVQGDIALEFEGRTKLHVLRSIKGDVKPGDYPIALGEYIGWEKDGSLYSYTSTEMAGDVRDVRQPNIWFLERKKGWDAKDPGPYYTLVNYRCVQPLVLETFYKTLDVPIEHQRLTPPLASTSDLVVSRTLRVINGDQNPWPFRDIIEDISLRNRVANYMRVNEPKRRSEYASDVWHVLDRRGHQTRQYAASVYASMLGRSSAERLRGLLHDKDPIVALLAAGYLITWLDEQSIPMMQSTMSRALTTNDPMINGISQDLADRLASWNDERLVASLITLLNFRTIGDYSWGDSASTRAQKALKQITGFEFPTNLPADQMITAWKRTQNRPKSERAALLLADLGKSKPFSLRFSKEGHVAWVTVTNISKSDVSIGPSPSYFEYRYDVPGAGALGGVNYESIWNGGTKLNASNKSVVLPPGASLRYRFLDQKEKWAGGVHRMNEILFVEGKDPASLTIRYGARSADQVGWAGELTVRIWTNVAKLNHS